jgi:flagellar hook protein FlgE
MGLQSAMTTALTGLQAAETTIDVVGNNVANSNTVGFKESNVLFATQFLQTQSIGSAPSDSRGGTNPRQIGLGTKVAAINPDFTQGTIEISANPLDVAIQGDGFLMVQGSQGERLYTRNGQLQTNANNEVVTVSGNRVLGFGVDEDFNIIETLVPIEIPLGAQTVAQATQNVFLSGALSPTAAIGDTPSIILSEVLGDVDAEFPNDPAFTIGDFNTQAPPTVTATTSLAGAGAVPAGDYQYRVAFFTTSGGSPTTYEGPPSTTFGNITVPAGPNQNIQLTGLPTDGSGNWNGRNLYRSLNGGAFELVGTLDATTANIVDSAAAGGVALDDDALDQTNYSYYVTFYHTGTGLESRPTGQIGSVPVSDVNRRIRIDNIPLPMTSDFDSVRIYRNTEANPSQFFLVDTLVDLETTYIDSTPDADIVGNPEIDLMGKKANAGTALTSVVLRDGTNYTTPFQEGVLTFEGKKGDRTLAPKQFTITATSTVGDLIAFMDEAFGIDDPDDPFPGTAGGQINSNGQIGFTANMGIENRLSVALSSFTLVPSGSSSSQSISVDFNETQEANGEGSTTDFVVFDSLGIPLNVRITTVMESRTNDSRTYRWFATSEDNEPSSGADTVLGNGTITFDANGRIISGATSSVAVARETTGSQSPQEFGIDFSQITGLDVRNNLGDSISTVSMTSQDGFPPGSLTSFIITESGLIRGVFSNGTERPLGQVRMARFANNTGLQQLGDNVFTKGVNSGEPVEGNPGDGGTGTLTAGAVELSNTDIGQNLIELILASTQYRGGTRVITAAQELLDELLSLRR